MMCHRLFSVAVNIRMHPLLSDDPQTLSFFVRQCSVCTQQIATNHRSGDSHQTNQSKSGDAHATNQNRSGDSPPTNQSKSGDSHPTNQSKPPWKVLFLGTDEFALHHVTALNENRQQTSSHRVVQSLEVVVPQTNRFCPVKSYIQRSGLTYHEWPLQSLSSLSGRFDVGVVTSFGHLIPERVINLCPYGILNVHPSLLPRWRGAAPITHTILNNDRQTGISIMDIRPKRFDTGPVLVQKTYPVPENCTTPQLRDFLAKEGSQLLLQTLSTLHLENKQKSIHQEELPATYANKLKVEHSQVDWDQQTVTAIDRQYRALSHKLPLRSEWLGVTVRLLNMLNPQQIKDLSVELGPDDSVQGTPHYDRTTNTLCIKCKDGWVGFRELVMKKPMTAKDFYNGYLSKKRNLDKVFKSLKNGLEL